MCGIFGYLRLQGQGSKVAGGCKASKQIYVKCKECGENGECASVGCHNCNEYEYVTPQMLYEAFEKIRPRGPDRSTFHEISEYEQMIYLGFQRLAIMDPTTDGDQPFTLESKRYEGKFLSEHRSIYVICNGEIYNHHQLIAEHGYEERMRGRSDCEFLPLFYAEHGIDKLCEDVRAESAMAVLDIDRVHQKITFHLARDPLAVRPLFIGHDEMGFGFCSEMKGLRDIIDETQIHQLRGGHRYEVQIDLRSGATTFEPHCYFDLKQYEMEVTDTDVPYKYEVTEMLEHMYPDLSPEDRIAELNKILTTVRETFERCVISVLESDVPLGALLSGGLDSSLVVAIAAKYLRKTGRRLRTFSVGIPGATDKEFAEAVAAEAGTDHTHVEFTIEDFIAALPHVIKAIESYDITTVRASTGQWLISKWVSENTDIKVLTQGDGADEQFSGYGGVFFADSPFAVHNDCVFRLRDIGYYDALRSDRGIASNGIEARTPFLHRDLVECVMKIDPRLKVPLSDNGLEFGKCKKRTEKWLLRMAFDIEYEDFDGTWRPYLPANVLYRPKEAFSDSISSKEKSWYEIIQDSVEDKYTQEDIDRWASILSEADTDCVPKTKEAVHFLEIFTQYYGKAYQVIPYYWMHSFTDSDDPSARTLSTHHE
jgi:asparagine synthase (glutamine-hydrolysing)